jgi:hypothetical protein
LALSITHNCVVCEKHYDAAGFYYAHDIKAEGPAYFSDKGALCSPQCALDHYLKRKADGDPMLKPARQPGVAGT